MIASPDDIVFTGYGLVCPLGDDVSSVTGMIRRGESKPFGIYEPAVQLGGRCQLIGAYEGDLSNAALGVSAGQGRFMGRNARLALKAARSAISQAGCETRELAVLVGSASGDLDMHDEVYAKLAKTGNMKKVSPATVPRVMASTVSANLSTVLGAVGASCSVSAACATGSYNMVLGALLLRAGAVKIVLAGGAEAPHVHFYAGFDSMRAFNGEDNDHPERASRPYAADRHGFILSEGAGLGVMETRASAEARGAKILSVLRGFGLASDGTGEMVAPSWTGGLAAMKAALTNGGLEPGQIEYINTHGTSTPLGDVGEVRAIRELFGPRHVAYSSTKGYTGHPASAAGSIEAIFTMEMLREGWIAPSIHASPVDPQIEDYPPVLEPTERPIQLAMSNSFGFGGTNTSLVLSKA